MSESKARRATTATSGLDKSVIPKDDTQPGPGLPSLKGKVEDIEARTMLGEVD